jgi:hypothetical protein
LLSGVSTAEEVDGLGEQGSGVNIRGDVQKFFEGLFEHTSEICLFH